MGFNCERTKLRQASVCSIFVLIAMFRRLRRATYLGEQHPNERSFARRSPASVHAPRKGRQASAAARHWTDTRKCPWADAPYLGIKPSPQATSSPCSSARRLPVRGPERLLWPRRSTVPDRRRPRNRQAGTRARHALVASWGRRRYSEPPRCS
jgi:hypothetical protein